MGKSLSHCLQGSSRGNGLSLTSTMMGLIATTPIGIGSLVKSKGIQPTQNFFFQVSQIPEDFLF